MQIGGRALKRACPHGTSVSEPRPVTWMLTCDAWPKARWPRGPDFTAFDGELIVGRVYQAEHGPDKGLWLWSMSVERPGPLFPGPVSGVEEQHGPAGRRVVAAYHALLKHAREASPERKEPLPSRGDEQSLPSRPEMQAQLSDPGQVHLAGHEPHPRLEDVIPLDADEKPKLSRQQRRSLERQARKRQRQMEQQRGAKRSASAPKGAGE